MPTSICTIRFQIRTIPCLAINLPPLSMVRCCRPIKFGRRPEGLPHHHPSPRTNPSKTVLYHPLFVMPTSICTIRFQIRTILFAFRRGVGLPLPLHRPTPFPQPLQKDNTPTPRTTTLASLVKGRWIGGKAQTLTLLHLLAICSPFLYCKLFCRQDGGIATPPFLASHQPLQNRTIPPAFRNANIYMHDTLSNSHYPIRFS